MQSHTRIPGATCRRVGPATRRRRHGGGAAVVSFLLLLLLPLGLLHRASTGACGRQHRGDVRGVATAAPGTDAAALDTPAAAHGTAGLEAAHDHDDAVPALDGAAPAACGPAIVAGRDDAASAAHEPSAPPAWRGRSPLALAPPPPAPPPRLG